jgi:cation diffusion facilitator CzcD-associated flavoprotein CzcO
MKIVLVGAGACGILTAVKLIQAGYRDLVILEKEPRLGGTWRDNRYPGLTCDVPSHLYSFSFAPNPDWSRVYSPQAEILAYLERVAARHGILERIRFGQEVVAVRFLNNRWETELRSGERLHSQFLFSGTGALVRPNYPDIPGLDDFQGVAFHTARWPAQHDFKGERVAVIGSAASATQLVPHVAAQAAQLHVFQRTANWILAKPDRAYHSWEKALFRKFPALSQAYRAWLAARLDLTFDAFRSHSLLGRLGEYLAARYLRSVIRDPQLRAALTPNYPMGCKRIILESDFYPTLLRPNVELVTTPIRSLGPHSLETSDGRQRPLDTLILATGFRLLNEVHLGMPVYGIGGCSLDQLWSQAPEAYKGVTVTGFPNLFLLLGPNTALGHNSVWLMAEAQADYAIRAIAEVDQRRAGSLEVLAVAQQDYNRNIQTRLGGLVWAGGCQSWYKTPEGKNFTIYPGTVAAYRRELAEADYANYRFV